MLANDAAERRRSVESPRLLTHVHISHLELASESLISQLMWSEVCRNEAMQLIIGWDGCVDQTRRDQGD